MKKSQLLTVLIGLLLIVFLLMVRKTYAGLAYNGGEYTNLCGTGTAATAHTCDNGCNANSGYCTGSYVVKYTCSGKKTDCRQNESSWKTYQTLSGSACNTTVQIDVFNKKCRDSHGSWTCDEDDLLDYIVWYSGNCNENTPTPTKKVTATPSPTRTPTATITPTTTRTPTATPRPSSTPKPTSTPRPSSTPRPTSTATPTPTGIPQRSSCDDLTVISGNDSLVPATVKFRAIASDNKGNIQKYRFYFGDGSQQETSNNEIEHKYEVSGTFTVKVEIKDSAGNWKDSSACQTTVKVKASTVESHKSACSDIFITASNGANAPSNVTFKITGYDNKGNLKAYKIDYGDGTNQESFHPDFSKTYQQAGTYTVKAFIKDSQGNWKGGDNSCKKTLYIKTKPLSKQPETGTPTMVSVFSILSGVSGFGIKFFKKKK